MKRSNTIYMLVLIAILFVSTYPPINSIGQSKIHSFDTLKFKNIDTNKEVINKIKLTIDTIQGIRKKTLKELIFVKEIQAENKAYVEIITDAKNIIIDK